MGCICSKGVRTNDDYIETCKKQSRNHENLDSDKTSVNGRNEATFRLIPNGNKNVLSDDDEEKESFVSQKEATVKLLETNVGPLQPRMSRIGNGDRTAKVVAGWPSWLVSVAGEALNGWLPLSADSFEKLEMVRLRYIKVRIFPFESSLKYCSFGRLGRELIVMYIEHVIFKRTKSLL